MEFEVLERTESKLRVKVLDADDSVMYPIMEQLIEDERVEESNYSVAHQELDEPVLTVVSDEEDPKKILIEITTKIKDQFQGVYDQLFGEEE